MWLFIRLLHKQWLPLAIHQAELSISDIQEVLEQVVNTAEIQNVFGCFHTKDKEL